jgi:predicted PhzF superfamily epimerase YddE/YHI9
MLSFYTLKIYANISSVTFIFRQQYRVHIYTCKNSVISCGAPLLAYYGPVGLNVLQHEVRTQLWQNFMCGEERELGSSSSMKDTFPVLWGKTKEY